MILVRLEHPEVENDVAARARSLPCSTRVSEHIWENQKSDRRCNARTSAQAAVAVMAAVPLVMVSQGIDVNSPFYQLVYVPCA